MTAVMVTLSPRRPLPDDGPPRPEALPYYTRPVHAAAEPVTQIIGIADLDEIAESAKCSCSAGDDNPH
jgi:hypothetical protein